MVGFFNVLPLAARLGRAGHGGPRRSRPGVGLGVLGSWLSVRTYLIRWPAPSRPAVPWRGPDAPPTRPDAEATTTADPDPPSTPRRRACAAVDSSARGHPPAVRARSAIVAVALVAVLAGSALFVSGWSLGRQSALTPGTPVDEAEAFQPFWDTYRAVTERYAGGDVDRKALVEGAIKGMIGALDDPYSLYLTSDEFKDSLARGPVGRVRGHRGDDRHGRRRRRDLDLHDARRPTAAWSSSPRSRARRPRRPACVAGDIIDAIDGERLEGHTVDAARDRVRGAKDTAVTLSIVRDGGAPFDVEIVRAVIVTPEVETENLAGGDGRLPPAVRLLRPCRGRSSTRPSRRTSSAASGR